MTVTGIFTPLNCFCLQIHLRLRGVDVVDIQIFSLRGARFDSGQSILKLLNLARDEDELMLIPFGVNLSLFNNFYTLTLLHTHVIPLNSLNNLIYWIGMVLVNLENISPCYNRTSVYIFVTTVHFFQLKQTFL